MCKKLSIFCFALVVLALSVSASAKPTVVPFLSVDINGENIDSAGNVIDTGRTQGIPSGSYPAGWPTPWKNWDLARSLTATSFVKNFGSGPDLGKVELAWFTLQPGVMPGSRNRGVPGTDNQYLSDMDRDLMFIAHSSGSERGWGQDYCRFTAMNLTPSTGYEFTFWAFETTATMVDNRKYMAYGTVNPAAYLNAHPGNAYGGRFTNTYGPTYWNDPCTTDVNESGIYKNPVPKLARLKASGPWASDDVNMTALGVPEADRPFYYSVSFWVSTDSSGVAQIYMWADHDTFTGSQHGYLNGFAIGYFIPEPTTVALLGLGGLSLLRRRKR